MLQEIFGNSKLTELPEMVDLIHGLRHLPVQVGHIGCLGEVLGHGGPEPR